MPFFVEFLFFFSAFFFIGSCIFRICNEGDYDDYDDYYED